MSTAYRPNYSQQKLVSYEQTTNSLDFHDFLSEVTTIQANISLVSQKVTTIATLHSQILSSFDISSPEAAQQKVLLESLVAETSSLNKHIRDEIKFLERDSKSFGDPNEGAKIAQVDKLKRGFDAELKNYQLMESQYRSQYREEIERQYRIVKPDASEDEIQRAVESGESAVFSQAILSSGRSTNAQSVASAVKSRHAEIQRIERTLVELLQLFEDMAREVEAAEPVVEQIDNRAETTRIDVEKAEVELGSAKEHAISRKRNKWICLGITVLIILIIAIALGIRFGPVVAKSSNNSGNKNSNDNSNATTNTGGKAGKRWV